jgi:hypothetical protein
LADISSLGVVGGLTLHAGQDADVFRFHFAPEPRSIPGSNTPLPNPLKGSDDDRITLQRLHSTRPIQLELLDANGVSLAYLDANGTPELDDLGHPPLRALTIDSAIFGPSWRLLKGTICCGSARIAEQISAM